MKKCIIVVGAFLLVAVLLSTANATIINYQNTTVGNEFYSPYAGVTTETFNGVSLGSLPTTPWTWAGNAAVALGTSGTAAAPYGVSANDATKYITVPTNSSSGSVLVSMPAGTTYNYLGLWWGSVDTYNTISFLRNGSEVASFTGSQAINPSAANGNQFAPSTNLYVNFLDLPQFDSFRMTSTSYAFEADNIAVGNVAVPEPATLCFLGFSLLGLGLAGKRQ
jgi:hypothetical protein